MGKTHTGLTAEVRHFIESQKIFFVATAPLSAEGHVNLSPKGLSDTLSILDEHTLAYLDLTGSGVETIAHLRENGRICFMFCAFEGPPRIVRVHGRGVAREPGDPEFEAVAGRFPRYPATRAIIVVHASRVSDSCGYGVPLYTYEGDRDQLPRWARRRGEDAIAQYRSDNNRASLDGLPSGLRDH